MAGAPPANKIGMSERRRMAMVVVMVTHPTSNTRILHSHIHPNYITMKLSPPSILFFFSSAIVVGTVDAIISRNAGGGAASPTRPQLSVSTSVGMDGGIIL